MDWVQGRGILGATPVADAVAVVVEPQA
jgi:hypothetical protein